MILLEALANFSSIPDPAAFTYTQKLIPKLLFIDSRILLKFAINSQQ